MKEKHDYDSSSFIISKRVLMQYIDSKVNEIKETDSKELKLPVADGIVDFIIELEKFIQTHAVDIGDEKFFFEDDNWSLFVTDTIPNSNNSNESIGPYLQINCPKCHTPNAIERGVNKRDMPLECVECETDFALNLSINEIE